MPIPTPNIWQLQSRGDIEALIEALRHPDATVRKGAAAALRALGAWQAVPALDAALTVENDWQAHAALSAALQYLDRDIHVETMIKNKDVRGLGKMLTSSKMEDIITACHALGKMGDRRAVESLVTVFRNPLLPSNVRLAAAEALLELESAPAVVTLLGALRRDNWQVRRNAAAVLGQLQAIWATEPLIELLNDQNQAVRRTAAAALRRINTPDAVKAASAFEDAQAKSATQELKSADGSSGRGTGSLSKPVTGTLSSAPKPTTQPLNLGPAKATAPLPSLPENKFVSRSTPQSETISRPPEPIITPPPAPEAPPVPSVPPNASSSPTPFPNTSFPNTDRVPTEPAMPQPSSDSQAGTKPLVATNTADLTTKSAQATAPEAVPEQNRPQAAIQGTQDSAPAGSTGPLSLLDKLRSTQQVEGVKPPQEAESSAQSVPATENIPPQTDAPANSANTINSATVTAEIGNGIERVQPIEPVITPPVEPQKPKPAEPEKNPDSGGAA